MNGPEPIGRSAKDFDLASRSSPGEAITSFSDMIPALKVASACRIAGSGCDIFSTTVEGGVITTSAMDSNMNWNVPPLSLVRARSSDHLMSDSAIGEPSANFRSGRIFSVTVSPSSDTS